MFFVFMLNLGCASVCVCVCLFIKVTVPFFSLLDGDCQAVERDLCSAHPLPVTGGGTHTYTHTRCVTFSPLSFLSCVRSTHTGGVHIHTHLSLSHTELQMDKT